MISYKNGDILSEDAEALVNTVNCVGVMGRGVALQFKRVYPENFKAYEKECHNSGVRPGSMFVFETGYLRPRYIINFPTKRHWRNNSRLADINLGLQSLVEEIRNRGIRSIAIPPLGCGEGKLNWAAVRNLMEESLADLKDVQITIFTPSVSPATAKGSRSKDVPKMTPARATLVTLVHQYHTALLAPLISLLELQKLMYFMQEAGENLKLKFTKAPHGPYAGNLRHLLNKMEGHMILGYNDGGDAPYKTLELMPDAMHDATTFLADSPETKANCDRVADLVEGFESPFGLELLSTVHWISHKENAKSFKDLVSKTHAWSTAKQKFSEHHLKIAADALAGGGWIAPTYDTN